jgi:hypothetical protein
MLYFYTYDQYLRFQGAEDSYFSTLVCGIAWCDWRLLVCDTVQNDWLLLVHDTVVWLVVAKIMSMEHWWNDTDKGKQICPPKILHGPVRDKTQATGVTDRHEPKHGLNWNTHFQTWSYWTYQSAECHPDPHCCFHCALDCLQRSLEAACVLAKSWPSLCQVCHLFYLLFGVSRYTWTGEDTFCNKFVYCHKKIMWTSCEEHIWLQS